MVRVLVLAPASTYLEVCMDHLASAVEAYSHGITPVALRPASKAPIAEGWTSATYTSREELEQRLRDVQGSYQEPINLGVALGELSGGLIDVDLDHPIAQRIGRYVLPDTGAKSGRASSPESHWWYRVTDNYCRTHQHALPESGSMIIEYRGNGAQTVIPPSIHDNTGERYEWDTEPWGISEVTGKELLAAVKVIALIVTICDNWPGKGGRHNAFLALVGGLLRDQEDDGTPSLHPLWNNSIEPIVSLISDITNDGDGGDSRVMESIPSTRRKILRGDRVHGWPALESILGTPHVRYIRRLVEEIEELDGRPRKFSYSSTTVSDDIRIDTTRKSEDSEEIDFFKSIENRLELASSTPIDKRDPLTERVNSWQPVDLALAVQQGLKPPKADILQRNDGVGLFYRGRTNLLYGSGGSGKTLIALHTALQEIQRGGRAMIIDFEDEPIGTLIRLQVMSGSLSNHLLENFTYISPDQPINPVQLDRGGRPVATESVLQARQTLAWAIKKHDPTLIIVDGITTLYGIHSLNTNDAVHTDAISGWIRKLTNNNTRTVILIDHTAKGAAPGATPMGSQHKIAMVQGCAIQVYATTPPRPGSTGEALLFVGKDRPGAVLQESSQDDPAMAAKAMFYSEAGRLRIGLLKPSQDSTLVVLPEEPAKPLESRTEPTRPITAHRGRPRSDREGEKAAVMAAITDSRDLTRFSKNDVMKLVPSMSAHALTQALTGLVQDGLLAKTGEGPSTRYQRPDSVLRVVRDDD